MLDNLLLVKPKAPTKQLFNAVKADLTCGPNPTTNSKTTNPNFHEYFYQSDQVLKISSICDNKKNQLTLGDSIKRTLVYQ